MRLSNFGRSAFVSQGRVSLHLRVSSCSHSAANIRPEAAAVRGGSSGSGGGSDGSSWRLGFGGRSAGSQRFRRRRCSQRFRRGSVRTELGGHSSSGALPHSSVAFLALDAGVARNRRPVRSAEYEHSSATARSSQKRGFFSFLRHPFRKPEPKPEPTGSLRSADLRRPLCFKGPCPVCPAGHEWDGCAGLIVDAPIAASAARRENSGTAALACSRPFSGRLQRGAHGDGAAGAAHARGGSRRGKARAPRVRGSNAADLDQFGGKRSQSLPDSAGSDIKRASGGLPTGQSV